MSEAVEVIVTEPSRPRVLEELEPLPSGVKVLAQPTGKLRPDRLVFFSFSDLDNNAERVTELLTRVRNLFAHVPVVLFDDEQRGKSIDWDLLQKSLVMGSEIH